MICCEELEGDKREDEVDGFESQELLDELHPEEVQPDRDDKLNLHHKVEFPEVHDFVWLRIELFLHLESFLVGRLLGRLHRHLAPHRVGHLSALRR